MLRMGGRMKTRLELWPIYTVHCTLYSEQCAVYSEHRMINVPLVIHVQFVYDSLSVYHMDNRRKNKSELHN